MTIDDSVPGAFEGLSPDLVLSAAEAGLSVGFESVVTPYNSYINRVYALKDEDGSRYVIKFYRPGRWSREAIAEEHEFLRDCAVGDIPVVEPVTLADGSTIGETDGYLYALFPFRGGRTFDISGDGDYVRLGSLIGRLHAISRSRQAPHRLAFHPIDLSLKFCDEFRHSSSLHPDFRSEFFDICSGVLERSLPLFDFDSYIRIHGDCHRGNILDRMGEGLLLIDFDDMMIGPPVQDLWLLLPDHLGNSRREMGLLLEGYTEFCPFDERSLELVEYLRFMRILYFLSWRETQRDDALFLRDNPDWGTKSFWIREIEDLRYQAGMTREGDA